jgi:O-antigen/teichoic acid export membrane protein
VSFKKSLLKNIVTLGGYNYSTQIAIFLSSIILSRLLLPEEYGFVALITVFTGFVSIFADAGLTFAIIRSDYGRAYHNSVTNLSFYIGISLFIIMLLLAYPITYFYNDKELLFPTIVMSTVFIIGSFVIVPAAILTKNLEFGYLGKVRLFANLFSILLMIVFAYLGLSYWSLIIPNLVLQIILFVSFEYKTRIGFRFLKISYPIVAYRKTKSLIKNLSTYTVIHYWSRNADKLIIGKYFSSYDLGIYGRAYKMLELALSLISGLFGTVLYPSLKKFQSEGGDIKAEYNNILGIISVINFPVGAIMILLPRIFVQTLWGENWMPVAEFLPYFGILIIFQSLIWVTGQMYLLLEREKTLMYIGVISAIILVLSIIIGAFFSVKVIAISYTVSYVIVIIPINLYYGFIKTFGYTMSHILKFWMPKLILGISILVALIFGKDLWVDGLMILFAIHLAYFQRHDLKKLKELVMNRLK